MYNEIFDYLYNLDEYDFECVEFNSNKYKGISVYGLYGEEHFKFRITIMGKNKKRAIFEYKGKKCRYNSAQEVIGRIRRILFFNKEVAIYDKNVINSHYLKKQVYVLLKLNEKEKFLSAYTEQNLRIDYNKLCSKYNESRAKIIELRRECSDERE